jgi:transketolase
MPIDINAMFTAGGFEVIEVNGHDFAAMWKALAKAYAVTGKPVLISAKTIMGKGIEFMEPDGIAKKASWHGKSPSVEATAEALTKIEMTDSELATIESLKPLIKWVPERPVFTEGNSLLKEVQTGEPKTYEAGTVTDCRSAYGFALLDLAKLNPNLLAITADLRESVKTDGVYKELPAQHLEVGIAEQHMVSLSGGLSLAGFIPFCSTFGAFMSSRAKDQARVNDINECNVKMVATHCGLSVGEDGPTHQAIDDMGSFMGMFNTRIIEPTDANQCDRIIRYIASHYGNFYVRMGRHKFLVILKEDGTLFYDQNYVYEYGKSDVIRQGTDLTIIASGACVGEALNAIEGCPKSVEVIAINSIKEVDQTILDSILKTGHVITVEDHNPYSGLGSIIAQAIAEHVMPVRFFRPIGVTQYQFSGTQEQLYKAGGIDAEAIKKVISGM